MKYLVLSSCPYGMACLDNKCTVVCTMVEHDPNINVSKSYPVPCEVDADCDCSQWSTVGTKKCICHSK